ncbi:hypothetical protein [Pseudomonas lundensis]|uniref:hypothetical protein n=1 Tax=Pseudomonas lundensis TaxID=86185 RepID=UPI000BA28718|nr:hypothetical protein [Pseudomonas lundensis]OZY31029.1 hypothetical protein CJF36_18860 [Pseudomonas lundensis]QPF15678.1 hypothetical protein IF654_22780 [Pseudomonas lundensis]
MAKRDVASALELWARWSVPEAQQSTGRSMLAKLIDNKGEIFFGGSTAASGGPVDSLEVLIESAVMKMAAIDQMRADVLRLECNAAWWQVALRRKIDGYDPRGMGHFEKALALGISLRTYRRRLAEAKQIIETLLGKS